MLRARLETIFRSAFTHLSWWKKLLMRFGIGFAGVGLVGQVVAFASENGAPGPGSWSWSAVGSGIGCLLGFVIGAALRVFLKLGLLAVGVLALALFGLSALGWVELPWSSLGETGDALGRELSDQTASLREFLTGFLPSSTMTGLGLFAGVTQKPRMDAVEAERREESDEG